MPNDITDQTVTDPTTTQVRIKILINKSGQYAAYGYNDMTDEYADSVLYDMMSTSDTASIREFWITATVPMPQVVEIVADSVEDHP